MSEEMYLNDRVADKIVHLFRRCSILEERLARYFRNYFSRFIPSANISHMNGKISNNCVSFYDYLSLLDPLGNLLTINANCCYNGNISFVLIDEDSKLISFKNFEDLYEEIRKRLEF